MKSIEQKMLQAIRNKKSMRIDNTAVTFVTPDAWRVSLFGKLIATGGHSSMHVTCAGWPTRTTRSRLNALFYAFANGWCVYQHKGETYYRTYKGGNLHMLADEWVDVPRSDAPIMSIAQAE